MRNSLTRANPFPREECGRSDCVLCFQRDGSGKRTKCTESNVGYQGQYSRCPTMFSYVGETSRTAYTRIKEHMANYRAAAAAKLPALPRNQTSGEGLKAKDVKSWMWEHERDCHGGVIGPDGGRTDFNFQVTGIFRTCLDRQIDEGLRMSQCESESF